MEAVTRSVSAITPTASVADATDIPMPFIRQTESGHLVDVNERLVSILGYDSVAQLLTVTRRRAEALYANPFDRGELADALDEAGEATREYALHTRDGGSVNVVDQARRVSVGDTIVYESFLTDVSAFHRRAETLGELEARYRTIVDAVAEGVYVARDGVIVWSSDCFNELLGMDADAVRGKALPDLVVDPSLPALSIQRRSGTDDPDAQVPKTQFRVMLRRRDEHRALPVEITESRSLTPLGPIVIGAIRDITRQLEAQKSLAYDALHDSLTGLPNRKYFIERLAQRMEPVPTRDQDGTFAVLFIDLDNFKLVNDAYGHEEGDRFLVEAVKRLRSCLRDTDVLSRHGGDEFTILVDNVPDVEAVTAIATRIQKSLVDNPLLDDLGLYTTSSIGIVIDNPRYQLPEEIMRDADTAMYQAKENGKAGYALFDSKMLQEVRHRLSLESELRLALDRDELVNHYQPIFSTSGKCVGMEALARWNHAERGVLGPSTFLPVLESSTVHVSAANHFFRQAIDDMRGLVDDGIVAVDFSVSLNLSERQLQSGLLPDLLDELLGEASLSRSRVTLEIIESVLSKSPHIVREIRRLKDSGFELAIDDFGTGTSSLGALRDLPVNVVKIDKSFLADARDSERGFPFLRKILETTAVLGLRTVAEGVERDEQLAFLRSAHCDYVQGFFLARPMSIDRIRSLLADTAY